MFSSRNSPRPDSIGANIFNSDGDGNEITQYAETSQKKREFRTSFASEQFWSIDEKTSSSSKCNNDGVSAPVQLLEEQLQQRDKTISQLHQTMEASEKVQSNRIYLLERQLEELVELSASDCAARRGRSVSLSHNPHTFEKNEQGYIAKDHDSHDQEIQGHQEAKIEISALQELLARVVAEKDRLRFKNDNLKLILLERRDSTAVRYPSTISESSIIIPSSIQELDNVIRHNEHKLISRIDAIGYGGKHLDPEDEWYLEQEHKSNDINPLNTAPNKTKSGTRASPEEHQMALYQMSCRNCPTDQSNVKYYRGCCSTTNNNTQALTSVVMHHFSQVCKMVQQQHYENGYESNPEISNSSNDERKNSGSFQSSSLARHLVMEHCQRFFKEEEVLKWCMENVKVEIQRKGILMHDNNDVPSASLREKKKKRQSKNGNEWKKRRER